MPLPLVSTALLAALASTPPAPQAAFAASPALLQTFVHSEVGRRIGTYGHQIVEVRPLGDRQVLVVAYVPKQGVGSEWDDESRLSLYRWDGRDGFERLQFVTKAGKSIPGHLAGLSLIDMDHDGQPEILVIGRPDATFHRETTLVLRREGPSGLYTEIFRRKDHLAAFSVQGPTLTYTFQDPDAPGRSTEHYRLDHGLFSPQ